MKTFNLMQNIGHAKYVVNYHNGEKKHADGSAFFDIDIFRNIKKRNTFVNQLIADGYTTNI